MPEWASENSNYVSNPTLDIAVHVDGSDSMLGYVTIPNSNYTRTIEVLSNSIIGTSNVNVTYHRIGDEKKISPEMISVKLRSQPLSMIAMMVLINPYLVLFNPLLLLPHRVKKN